MLKFDNSLLHQTIFDDEIIAGGLGEILFLNGKKQLRIAENGKYDFILVNFANPNMVVNKNFSVGAINKLFDITPIILKIMGL